MHTVVRMAMFRSRPIIITKCTVQRKIQNADFEILSKMQVNLHT